MNDELFKVEVDAYGDLRVNGGRVRNLAGTVALESGTVGRQLFLGGSGRNLVFSGFPGATEANGAWRYVSPGKWTAAEMVLTLAEDGLAEIADAEDVVLATLAADGPLGDYESTAEGETAFGGPFTAVAVAEDNAPGVFPDGELTVSAGAAPTGTFSPVDDVTWALDEDTDWTITVAGDGRAELKEDGVLIGVRAAGNPGSPEGIYEATFFGQLTYNPAPDPADPEPDADPDETAPPDAAAEADETTEDDADVILPGDAPEEPTDAVPVNPYGVLTLAFSWEGSFDLDTGTTFNGATVGFGHSGSTAFLGWTGDDTSESGDEIATVDLAKAWRDGVIREFADILVAADWYPPSGGSGPAVLTVSYSRSSLALSFTIHPGAVSPATTQQMVLRVRAGAVLPEPVGQPWQATVALVPVPPPEGVVFVKVTEAAGELDSCEAAAFAATLPPNSGDDFHLRLAEVDGDGVLGETHAGVLFWR